MANRPKRYPVLILLVVHLVAIFSGCKQSEGSAWVRRTIDTGAIRELQDEVDNGHRPGLLDPGQVIYEFLLHDLGFDGAISLDQVSEWEGGRLIRVTLENGEQMEVQVVQPVRKDPSGIWVVEKYRRLE